VPVFVDDSGRRRRAGRLIAAAVAVAVLAYLAVIGLSVAGVPYIGHLAPPGLDRLSSPSGDAGVVTGPAVDEVPLPAAPDPSTPNGPGTGEATATPAAQADGPAAPATVPTADTTVVPTSTTVTHGQGETPTDTSPNSTVPTSDPGGGRRPDSPPGQG
jgi:hypothetical protein